MSLPNLSRRNFLTSTAAGLVGATCLGGLAGFSFADEPKTDSATKDRFGGWPVGIQSYTLRNFKFPEALRHIQNLDLHYVEMFGAHFATNASDDQIAEMKTMLDKANVKLVAHGVNGFSKDHAANKKLFEFAKKAGFKNITADPSPDSFDSLDKLCAEYGIRICIHNHGPGARYDKLTDVQKAVKGHHELIGACVDTGHVLRSNEDPVKWVKELGPRVFALHIKDVKEKQNRTHDVVIGTAHLDLVGLFKALKEVKFPKDGSISLEYESNPNNPVADVKECLVKAEEAIAKAAA